MANYVNITLDTTSPTGVAISIDGGATFTSDAIVTASFSMDDVDTTGYQMKIWGDVDGTADANVATLEANSTWITYAPSYQVTLAGGDGTKTLFCRVRDNVFNESSSAQDSITLDTAKPVVTVTAPDVDKISKITGRNVATFSFTVDTTFVEYQVRAVASTGAGHTTGTLIPITNGSTNTSGEGTFDTSTSPVTVSINGSDLELANAGDGTKIIKVFARDDAGNWSA